MKKKIFRLYFVWQEEKEEAWLDKLAKKGWFLKKYYIIYYVFEKRQPEEMIYKLDFQLNIDDFTAYQKLFEEAGWEYVTSYINWHYFRGKKDDVVTDEIYTDKTSIRQKYRRVSQMLSLVFLFLCLSTIGSYWTLFTNPIKDWSILPVLFSSSVLLLLLYGIIKIRLKIKRVDENVKLI